MLLYVGLAYVADAIAARDVEPIMGNLRNEETTNVSDV